MKEGLPYSSVMTGAAFMLYEFKQVARLKRQGLSDGEVRKLVIRENVFQYEKISSLQRGLPSLLRRVNALDETLLQLAAKESSETVKGINLYALMKTDRLFFEFMREVVTEKIINGDEVFEKKDLNSFFTTKAEQSEEVASWKEATVQKLKQVYIRILKETGFLTKIELQRIIVDEEVYRHLVQIGDKPYAAVLNGEV